MNSNTFKKGKYYLDSRDGELVEVLEDGRLRVLRCSTFSNVYLVGDYITVEVGMSYGNCWVECPRLKALLLKGGE